MLFNKLIYLSEDGDGGAVSENTQEVAAPEEDSVDESEDTEASESEEDEAEPATQQSPEENAVYANMRRKAEADARKAFEAREKALNERFSAMFGSYKDPVTGKAISSAEEYLNAIQAQERKQMESKLKAAGVDTDILNRAIEANPVVQQARQVMLQNQQAEVNRMMEEDFKNIMSFDHSVQSTEDITKQDNFMDVIQYVQNHPGMRMSEAYKIVNFDRLMNGKAAASSQAAINQAKGKSHLGNAPAAAAEDKDVEVPASEIARWKAFFDEDSPKKLKERYNRYLRSQKG